jgi:hypothetical protein
MPEKEIILLVSDKKSFLFQGHFIHIGIWAYVEKKIPVELNM